MSDGDPFAVLGLPRTATLADVREARRRLAFELHPDHGGDVAAMQRLNVAFAACVALLRQGPALRGGSRPSTSRPPSPSPSSPPAPAPAPAQRQRGPAPRRRHVEQDFPSFTIDALPAEAYEALLVVASWIGDVLDDDPPYVLECVLSEPVPCWCRLDLVPDAGGSTVSLTVASLEAPIGDTGEQAGAVDGGVVSAELVRDVWVDQLNRLGRPQP